MYIIITTDISKTLDKLPTTNFISCRVDDKNLLGAAYHFHFDFQNVTLDVIDIVFLRVTTTMNLQWNVNYPNVNYPNS